MLVHGDGDGAYPNESLDLNNAPILEQLDKEERKRNQAAHAHVANMSL